MAEWHLEANGKPVHITTDRGPNGKIAVRLDGRIIAPPQSPDDIVCQFRIGMQTYLLTGREEQLRLDPIVAPAPATIEPSPAVVALASARVQAAIFAAIGAILFAVAMIEVISMPQPRFTADELRDAARDRDVQSVLDRNAAIRFAFFLEAAVGLAAIGGAGMLYTGLRSARLVLHAVAWSVAAAGLIGIFLVDLLAHRQVSGGRLSAAKVAAYLHDLHVVEINLLIALAVVAGVLLTVLQLSGEPPRATA